MTELVGSVLNLRPLAGAKVASVEVVDDSEVVIHASSGSFRLRAEKERRQGEPSEPVGLVCRREAMRP